MKFLQRFSFLLFLFAGFASQVVGGSGSSRPSSYFMTDYDYYYVAGRRSQKNRKDFIRDLKAAVKGHNFYWINKAHLVLDVMMHGQGYNGSFRVGPIDEVVTVKVSVLEVLCCKAFRLSHINRLKELGLGRKNARRMLSQIIPMEGVNLYPTCIFKSPRTIEPRATLGPHVRGETSFLILPPTDKVTFRSHLVNARDGAEKLLELYDAHGKQEEGEGEDSNRV